MKHATHIFRKYYIPILIISLIASSTALANVVWPAAIVAARKYTDGMVWAAIAAGILIELFLLNKVFTDSFRKVLLMVLVANLVSALLGWVLIPLSGILHELSIGLILSIFSNYGTFSLTAWINTFILTALTSTIIESGVYRFGFKKKFHKSKIFLIIFLSNTISTAVTYLNLYMNPLSDMALIIQ